MGVEDKSSRWAIVAALIKTAMSYRPPQLIGLTYSTSPHRVRELKTTTDCLALGSRCRATSDTHSSRRVRVTWAVVAALIKTAGSNRQPRLIRLQYFTSPHQVKEHQTSTDCLAVRPTQQRWKDGAMCRTFSFKLC